MAVTAATIVKQRMGRAASLAAICRLLDAGDVIGAPAAVEQLERAPVTTIAFPAARLVQEDVPVVPKTRCSRPLTVLERLRVCQRDGVVDRLSPERWPLVYPGVFLVLQQRRPQHLHMRLSNGAPRSHNGNSPVVLDLGLLSSMCSLAREEETAATTTSSPRPGGATPLKGT